MEEGRKEGRREEEERYPQNERNKKKELANLFVAKYEPINHTPL